MNWNETIREIVIGAAGDGTGGLVAGALVGAGRRLARRFEPPPQRAALDAAFVQAVETALGQYDDLSALTSYYLECLTAYLRRELVREELAQLLEPGDSFDTGALRTEFKEVTQGYTPEQIPDLDFDSFIQTLAGAFYEAVKGQTVLQPIIQIERLDALVRGLGRLTVAAESMGADVVDIRNASRQTNQLLTEVRDLLAETRNNDSFNQLLSVYIEAHKESAEGGVEQHTQLVEELRFPLAEYVRWMAGRSGVLELRGVKREDQQVVQLDLDVAYVPLTAEVSGARLESQGEPREVPLNEVLALGKRLTVIGGPGSGKTTLLLYLAWTLAYAIARDEPEITQGRLGLQLQGAEIPLPIFLPLSAYARHLRKVKASATIQRVEEQRLDFYVSRYLAESHANFGLPEDFFARLLAAQRPIILLLDGLDEVPNERERVEVRSKVEQLADSYPELRIVVTCRSAAHKGRTVLGRGFRTVQVQPLAAEQVDTLIARAYEHIFAHDQVQREEKTQKLQGSVRRLEMERRRRLGEVAPRLIDTPLMVRLLLIVHYSERELPEQRAELYMLVTQVLLLPDYNPDEAAADELGEYIGGSMKAHLQLVQYLAFRLHERGEEQGRSLDEREVIDILSENPEFAPHAERLVYLTRLRGTMLKEEGGAYSFIHLTFQEFLCARYLATEIWQSEKIIDYLLAGPILDSWWREVILLLAGFLFAEEPLGRGVEIVRKLATLDWVEAEVGADETLAAAELAGLALLEWPEERPALQAELATRLMACFADESQLQIAAPVRRVGAGTILGRLGDRRPGVGVLPGDDGSMALPDMRFCYVPPGPFWMSEDDEEKGRVYDGLDYGYWLSRYPITNAQFAAFVAAGGYDEGSYWLEAQRVDAWNHGRFKGWRDEQARVGPYRFGAPFDIANHPVVGVSWYEAVAFCRWLSEQLNLPAEWQVQLPSEPEWEKGARGGLKVPVDPLILGWAKVLGDLAPETVQRDNPAPRRSLPWLASNLVADLSEQDANFGEKIGTTAAAGCYPRNRSPYGIVELIGNVWEWTRSQDGPLPYTIQDGREDFSKVTDESWLRLRGGDWYSAPERQRCGARDWLNPFDWFNDLGFRIVLSPLS
ncbi:MAG: SUMF1/EgtB/PvdO family nonheme iron enzyme, partial [Anaerolineales bacterium]|nr:SUMF1/EgtB/PvdO family nonheme iron enzyme [Anaerolineales bacterium]